MFAQYVKFLINGGGLGLVAVLLHAIIYRLLGGSGDTNYAVASVLTYIPLIIVNYLLQQSLIFSAQGRLWKFIVANALIMVFVSAIAPLCKDVVGALLGPATGINTGFVLASLIGATPSFGLARYWVFRTEQKRGRYD